ncbi:MAG: SRPBCC family protein [Patescibacteria group bacterium]|jgi:carbon monoxide dehydrogenase subunit G
MYSVKKHYLIRRPISRAWGIVSDPRRLAAWMPGVIDVRMLEDAPRGNGLTWRVILETEMGRWEIDQQIIEWREGSGIVWRDIRSFLDERPMTQITNMQTAITLEKHAEGTLVYCMVSWNSVGIGGKVFSVLYFTRMITKMIGDAFVNLAQGI